MHVPLNKRYLIAVSGGPDSMALLDMVHKSGAYLEAAHVNYHKRDSAKRDEKIVRSYCRKNGIRFHLYDYDGMEQKGNFQAAARNARYDFFKRVCDKNRLDEVLVAHQMDDLIETYLMQKEKGIGVSYFGLKERNLINGVSVYRPLLGYTKKQLLSYCEKENVPYGIDESNLQDHYRRNRIRHQQFDKMSESEKKRLVKKIETLNADQEERLRRARECISKGDFTVSQFKRIPYLKAFLHENFPNKSDAHLDEMIRQLQVSQNCLFEGKQICICKEYGRITVFSKPQPYAYSFKTLRSLKGFACKEFSIAEKGEKIQGVCISKNDLPLIIRNGRKEDRIKLRYGHKKLNRFFIDRKMSCYDRMTCPVIENGKGNVIFVSGIGCDTDHYCEKPNIFMIKL